MGAGRGLIVFEAMVLDGITWQVNAHGEGRRPEALGLSSGAPSRLGIGEMKIFHKRDLEGSQDNRERGMSQPSEENVSKNDC